MPRGRLWTAAICELLVADGAPRVARELVRRVRAAAPVDYVTAHFPAGPGTSRAALRLGFVPSPGGHEVLVNPREPDPVPDPTETASWALSYGDLELL